MGELIPGQLVFSRAGRDQGRYFLVYQVFDDGYVSLVDGSLRKVERPKRKKRKHLRGLDLVANELTADAGTWTNSKVASAIETLLGSEPVESDSTAGGGFDPWPNRTQLK